MAHEELIVSCNYYNYVIISSSPKFSEKKILKERKSHQKIQVSIQSSGNSLWMLNKLTLGIDRRIYQRHQILSRAFHEKRMQSLLSLRIILKALAIELKKNIQLKSRNLFKLDLLQKGLLIIYLLRQRWQSMFLSPCNGKISLTKT